MGKSEAFQRKLDVLHFIREKAADGIPPSVREICQTLNIKSTSTVHFILCELEDEGFIVRDTKSSRGIRLAGAAPVAQVPILGRVTAGIPVLAVEQIEGYIPMAKKRGGVELFALRVSGLSMKNAGIFDGDIVVAEYDAYVANGDIVIALIGDETTVKRYFKENGGIRLQPENDDFEPIFDTNIAIIGKVVSLIRNFK